MARHYIVTDFTVKLNDKSKSTDPVFDQISVRLSDAAHRNMNQKICHFLKALISDGLSMLTHFSPMSHFYIPTFSGGIEM